MRLEELGKYIKEISHRNKKLEIQDVFSVTNSEGFMLSTDYFSKEVFSKDISNYKIVSQNQFAYNPSRINVGSIDYLRQDSKVIISPLYVVFECNTNLNESYLKFFLKSPVGNLRIRNKTKGAVRETLSFKSLSQIRVPIFPLETQLHIANILSNAESLIAQRKESIRLLDEYLKSVFLEMFGDPVRNEKDWEIDKVISFVDCIVPGRDKPKSFTGDIPWLTTEDLNHLSFSTKSNKNIALSQAEIEEVRARLIPSGSVLMTCVGDLGIISINKTDCVVNQQLHTFQCKASMNNIFLMFALSFQKAYMYKTASTTTVPYMNKTICNSIPVIQPPLVLQTKFAQIVEITEALKAQYHQSLQELENLYGSLSQKAFKGELSIKDESLLSSIEPSRNMAAEPETKYTRNRNC